MQSINSLDLAFLLSLLFMDWFSFGIVFFCVDGGGGGGEF